MGEIQAIEADALLSAFSGASQHKRLMRLHFPSEDGPPAILLPNKLVFHEAVSCCFRGVAELLSDDPRIPLKVVIGKMVTVSLLREDGSLRYFNGYITEFRFLRSDGGFAFYQIVFEPWLAFTRLRKDCVSFHNKTVREITEGTLKHGCIAIEHASGTQGYTVELANGDKFDLKAWEKFDPKDKALHHEQLLSNEGARALDGSAEGRTYS